MHRLRFRALRSAPETSVRSCERSRHRLFMAVIALAPLLAACGSDDSKPSPTGPSTSLSANDQLLEQGLADQGAGRLDKAREAYLAVLSKDPNNKIAYYDLGVVNQQLNDTKGAAEAYRKALAIDPSYQPALFNLAVLLSSTEPEAAVDLYKRILAINPDDANVHFNLGLLLREMGRAAEGNAEVERALQIKPELASRLPPTNAPGSTPTTKKP